MVGYIEEEDDHEDDDEDDDDDGEGKTYTSETEDSRNGDAYGSERRGKAWLSGSDSEGGGGGADRRTPTMPFPRRNSRATPPRAAHLSIPRAYLPRGEDNTPRLGRLASFSGHGDSNSRAEVLRARASAQRRHFFPFGGGGGGGPAPVMGIDDSRSSRATSCDEGSSGGAAGRGPSAEDGVRKKSLAGSSDGSGSESENAKRMMFRRRSSSAAVGASTSTVGAARRPAVGPAVKLSAEAAAIVHADPLPPAATQAEDASTVRINRSMSAPAEQESKPAAAAAAGGRSFVAPKPGQTITASATAPGAPVSTVGGAGLQDRPRSTSLNDTRPLTGGRPVPARWMEVCSMCNCSSRNIWAEAPDCDVS